MGKLLPHVPGVRNELARCAAHQGVSTPPQYACAGCQCRVNEPYCAAISLLLSVIKWATPENSLFAACPIVAWLSNVIELLNSVLWPTCNWCTKHCCQDTIMLWVVSGFVTRGVSYVRDLCCSQRFQTFQWYPYLTKNKEILPSRRNVTFQKTWVFCVFSSVCFIITICFVFFTNVFQ